jgi:hypothetical protein
MIEAIIWIAVLFFSGTWTIGLITQPNMRMKNTIVTVVYWWIEIFLAYQSSYDVVHLLWLMPLSMAVPFLFILTRSVLIMFIQSAVILAPALYFLIS